MLLLCVCFARSWMVAKASKHSQNDSPQPARTPSLGVLNDDSSHHRLICLYPWICLPDHLLFSLNVLSHYLVISC